MIKKKQNTLINTWDIKKYKKKNAVVHVYYYEKCSRRMSCTVE